MEIIAMIQEWLPKICVVVAACAAIATVTPTESDDKFIGAILSLINKLGLNVGKAKNKDAA